MHSRHRKPVITSNCLFLCLLVSIQLIPHTAQSQSPAVWWVGTNFTPSTAVNQLEFWQQPTFDTATINRELGYAASIGMNCMRVFLHHVAWQQDSTGLLNRMDQYLAISTRHHIQTMFVFFDDCWNDDYAAGPQPAPKPGIHNSRWLKDPGNRIDTLPLLMDTLQQYVTAVVTHFRNDTRICCWDLYNEPGHFKHGLKSMPLLKNTLHWVKACSPVQPVTMGIWNPAFTGFNQFQLACSDVISFHNYRDTTSLKEAMDTLVNRGKMVVCTEYMKRPNNSTFTSCLPLMKRYGVGAINWGLVAGKTQTNYPQGNKGGEPAPALWYHDIFYTDGHPFDETETSVIRRETGKNSQ
ncbi:cellulase family glycosylhydrolase [Deminuibacter soli]|uniref:1,4-beta-xylanase n=1 Tax=Deminuibacter soli TaxID=2291815 RepID=A0A3E1NIP2_9BACT|nr:cellulase family glycosylhydrolase [Deminuibacter soli]RFM27782.1 1,4-beta-xylanase [Deminuibacter soli]